MHETSLPVAQTTLVTIGQDGRRVNPDEKKYQLTELTSLHAEILRNLAIGIKPREISRLLGVTENTISNVRNAALSNVKLRMLNEKRDRTFMNTQKRALEMMPRALDLLDTLLAQGAIIADTDPTAALKIAGKVMEVAHYPAPGKGTSLGVNVNVNSGGTGQQAGLVRIEDIDKVREAVADARSAGVIEVIEEEEESDFDEQDLVNVHTPGPETSDPVRMLLIQDGFITE